MINEPPSEAPAGLASAWRIVPATALAYAAVGAASLTLAVPPGYASPLYPAAGLALAAVLSLGRAALPGVWLGALVVNIGLGLLQGHRGTALLVAPLFIALGVTLQAGLGAALLRRFVGDQPVLNAPREIALAAVWGGPLACLVSASVGIGSLVAAGMVPAASALSNFLTWYIGDVLGVFIGAPLALTLIGHPAADWRPRRRTLALPLAIALALVAAAVREKDRLDRNRQHAIFERYADRLTAEAQSRLTGALYALQALHGAARAQGGLTRDSLRQVSRWWLEQPVHLQATGHSVYVAEGRVAEFEAAAHASGQPGFRVFDRDGGRARAASGELLVVRHIEPEVDNAAALGVNAMSIPAAREAIDAARRSGEPTATAAFRLTQSTADEAGVVLYQALYHGAPTTPQQRLAQFAGVVFVTLRSERALADLASPSQSFLRWCLTDTDPAAPQRRLAGRAGCEAEVPAPGDFVHQRELLWGGRSFSFRVHATPGAALGSERESTWLLALSGMSAAAMLGALLLTVTGHNRRTELAVRNATEQLRGQVAERRQAEQALRESGARLRTILDNVPLGVMFTDRDGVLIECNPRFGEMAARPVHELLGRSVAELVHPDDVAVIRRMRRDLVEGQAAGAVESIRMSPAGRPGISVRVSVSALRTPAAGTLRLVGVVQDITEHLRLQASELALNKAEAASRAKSEFVSRMSHELRTPLNAMIGFAQLLSMDREPALVEHQRDWTQHIQRAGWHLLEMINGTLDLARIESGALKLHLVPLALPPVLAASRALVETAMAQHRVTITEHLQPDALAVQGDATRVKQVLTNLLSNAVKYNRVGGTVEVRSRRVDADGASWVEVAVTDTGLGMTAAQRAALFQPYNRLGRERSGIEGTGIGLVISLGLVELMGGRLEVDSIFGQGSTFTLRLPAAEVAELPTPRDSETSSAPYQHRLVHYVEDNETNIEVMRGIFAQRPQIRLETSTLGLDGLAAIRAAQPDLVLLDMQLPDISGLELLRHLMQDDLVASIPVVVVSADATPPRMRDALNAGALHYVTKPVEVERFLQIVDEILLAAQTRWG